MPKRTSKLTIFVFLLILLLGYARPVQAEPIRLDFKHAPNFAPASAAAGDAQWQDGFGFQGVGIGQVYAVAVDGDDLFVGGSFTDVGQLPANSIAHWDGHRWHALGEGIKGYVYAIAVSGDSVYVGGSFTTAGDQSVTNLAKWDRKTETWSAMGDGQGPRQGASPVEIYAITAVGQTVYVGGARFDQIDGVASNSIASYDPATNRWQALGHGVATCYSDDCSSLSTATVRAIMAGPGGKIYVGGDFKHAGNANKFIPVYGVTAWEPAAKQWSALGRGLAEDDAGSTFGAAYAFAVNGPDVYVGGQFKTAGGLAARSVAQWSTTTKKWRTLGNGVATAYSSPARVTGLALAKKTLYASGDFETAGTVAAKRVAQYDLAKGAWAAVDKGFDNGNVYTLVANADDGILIAGDFDHAGATAANRIVQWTGKAWQALGNGVQWSSILGRINAIAVGNDQRIYVGGYFTNLGGQPITNVAVWDGARWSALGDGLGTSSDEVFAVAIHGDEVYFGGSFSKAGKISASHMARWNIKTQKWSALGSGIPSGGEVYALAFDPDGMLYVGGTFDAAGNVAANNIARWDPTANKWNKLGAGIDFGYSTVYALAADNTGVFIGGDFANITVGDAEQPVNGLVYWNREKDEVSFFGQGLTRSGSSARASGTVRALAVTDDGEELYVGGEFDQAGEVAANNIALLNKEGWAALGDSVGGDNAKVQAIRAVGSTVYVGGLFEVAGTATANNLGQWDRTSQSWHTLGSGITLGGYDNGVYALAATTDALYVGGRFSLAGDKPNAGFAIWGATTSKLPANPDTGDTEPATTTQSEDDFSSAANWDLTDLPKCVTAQVAKGGLQIDLQSNKTLALIAASDPVEDAVAEVEIRHTKGAAEDYAGLVCRAQENGNFYWFLVSSSGYYRIDKQVDGEMQVIVDWTTSDALETAPNAINKIQIRCVGSELSLVINDTPVETVEDNSVQGVGYLQLVAFSTPKASKGTHFVFDNLVIAAP
ncbi:MAG: hypothetical protein NT075_25675 [Chloroflexi bacterium]|nr:hypothetical protein [Chloroflexota bacterium]